MGASEQTPDVHQSIIMKQNDQNPVSSTASSTEPSQSNPPRQIFLFLENPRKQNNWGPVLRCASAFGISTVVVVGFDKCSVEGSHGASKHVQMVAFPTATQAANFLTTTCQCRTIVGLLGGLPGGYEGPSEVYWNQPDAATQSTKGEDSILAKAESIIAMNTPNRSQIHSSINSHLLVGKSFPVSDPNLPLGSSGNIALAVSKDAHGLPQALAEHCHTFCHVPHAEIPSMDPNDDEHKQKSAIFTLLDLPATMSIIFHHFAMRLGYHEGIFEGHKFHVAVNSQNATNQKEEVQQRRAQIRQEAAEGEAYYGDVGFGDVDEGDY